MLLTRERCLIVTREGGQAVIAVVDEGEGIAAEQVAAVVRRFDRGAASPAVPGSGLGLSLVSALMEAHGGRAYLSAGPKGGTRAVLEFPVQTYAEVAC